MKPLLFLSGALPMAALTLAGCAAGPKVVFSDPVGPTSPPIAERTEPGSDGSLIVYSAWDGLDALDPEHWRHESYEVHAHDGTCVARVRNRNGSFEHDPQVVTLKPGRYLVAAPATNFGEVEIPVLIRQGQTTVVYLDGTTAPPADNSAGSNWVRQSNGLIVGWKAPENPN